MRSWQPMRDKPKGDNPIEKISVGDKSVDGDPIGKEHVGGAPCGDWIGLAQRLQESPQGAPPTAVGVCPAIGVTPNTIRASLSHYVRLLYPGPYGENKNAKSSQKTSPNIQ